MGVRWLRGGGFNVVLQSPRIDPGVVLVLVEESSELVWKISIYNACMNVCMYVCMYVYALYVKYLMLRFLS